MNDFDFFSAETSSKNASTYRKLVIEVNRCMALARARKTKSERWWGIYEGNSWDTIMADRGIYRPHDIQLPEFNQIKKYIDSVIGQQLNTKRKISYTARSVDKSISSEMLSQAAEWFADSANLDAETADVFKDTVIGGIGCLEISLDFSRDPQGAPFCRRIDPKEMIFDVDAQRTNMSDSRYMFRLTPQPLGVLKAMFPECHEEQFGYPVKGTYQPKVADIRALAEGDYPKADADQQDAYSGTAYDEPTRLNQKRWLLEARWIEQGDPYWLDCETWDTIDDEEQYQLLRKLYPGRRFIEGHYQCTCRAYLGAHGLLQDVDEPLCRGGSFGWIPLTCYRETTKKDFYGLVKNAIDPQMFINQCMAIISKNLMTAAKGGVMVEKGAVDDPVKFETQWSCGDSVIYINDGRMQGIKDKPLGEIAPVVTQTLEFAERALPESMGISPEFMGMANRNQPNILEQTRKQSTLNVLTEVYDNLRRWRMAVGDAIAYIIQHWVPNGILMRISDNDEAKYVQFARESVANLNYDVIVDDVPNSVNDREKTFAYLQQMIPTVSQMLQNNIPMEVVIEYMRYSPLPPSFVAKISPILQNWLQEQQQNMQQQQQAAQQGQQQQLMMAQQQAQAQAQQRQMEFQLKSQEILLKREEIQSKAQLAQMEQQAQAQIEQQRLQMEAQSVADKRADAQIRAQAELARGQMMKAS